MHVGPIPHCGAGDLAGASPGPYNSPKDLPFHFGLASQPSRRAFCSAVAEAISSIEN